MDDEHIIEALGKARIKVKKGEVVELGEPEIDYCPIFDKYRGIKKLTPENVKENIEFRIKDFGFCTSNRTLKMRDFLSFGVSETLSTLMEEKILDAVVTVCEGCGTVIVTDSDLVQGIGGRVSGLVSTTPLTEIIQVIGNENVLNPTTAEIDQLLGVEKAIKMGYRRIGVTLVDAEDVKVIKGLEDKYPGVNIYIFVAHVTGTSPEDAEILFQYSDVITSCASKWIRKIGEEKSYFKAGDSIPIYGVTDEGEQFLKLRIEKIGGLKDKKNPKLPDPLI